MNLYHFYHVYADGINILPLINQHIINLEAYGLRQALTETHVGLVGTPENRKMVKEQLLDLVPWLQVSVEQDSGFEQVTQNMMLEHAHNNDGYYLYTHTKGASNPAIENQCWARSMEFFTVVQWRQALEHLEAVDAVGCHWITEDQLSDLLLLAYRSNNPQSYPYFGGNYWWAKAATIRSLGIPDLDHRYSAEFWIGKKPGIKIHDLCPGYPGMDKFVITY